MTSENFNSLSKQEAIQQLRKTIGQLETIIEELNKTSVTELPSSSAIENLTKTTTELAKIIPQKSVIDNQEKNNITLEAESKDIDAVNQKKQVFVVKPKEETKNISSASKVETNKTESKAAADSISKNRQKVKNNRRNILIAVAIFVITIIPLSWELFIAQKNPTRVSQNPTQTIIEKETDTDFNQDIVENIEPSVEDSNTETIISTTEDITEAPTIPEELLAEERPKKVAVKTIKAPKNLTSEQNLIAAIENKERELIDRYTNDLITLIEPNFEESIVTVTLTDDWYDMESSNQDEITEKILKKSRALEFNKLKIIDSQNNLIARSPVVGKDIVILRRTI